jgi:hypothetical protein
MKLPLLAAEDFKTSQDSLTILLDLTDAIIILFDIPQLA